MYNLFICFNFYLEEHLTSNWCVEDRGNDNILSGSILCLHLIYFISNFDFFRNERLADANGVVKCKVH